MRVNDGVGISHPCCPALPSFPVTRQQVGWDSHPDSFCPGVSDMETRSTKLLLTELIEKSPLPRSISVDILKDLSGTRIEESHGQLPPDPHPFFHGATESPADENLAV